MAANHFIREQIKSDMKEGGRTHGLQVHTRFAPEPNGYLHIGHAKAIHVNVAMAREFGGVCNLRFDDANPEKEKCEYVDSIKEDVVWLTSALDASYSLENPPWHKECYTSDYFHMLYTMAVELIRAGRAFIDEESVEEMKTKRGSWNEPGRDSGCRERPVDESVRLFVEMARGKHPEKSMCLRAKIDMTSANMNMRDPVIYRILHRPHHRKGDQWCIYPTSDFARGVSDAHERITHSICTMEFDLHRELYDWCVENISSIYWTPPKQFEFGRLNLTGALMSKRKLLALVEHGVVRGWNDPRLPTLSGLRRRGVRPAAIKAFCDAVGVSKSSSVIPADRLDECVRENLENVGVRRMMVLDPLEVEIRTLAAPLEVECPNHPQDKTLGSRSLQLTPRLYVDRSDYQEDAPNGFFRLSAIGSEVKLRFGLVIRLDEVVRDAAGRATRLVCSHDAEAGLEMPKERKVKGVVHWVSAEDGMEVEARLYNSLLLEDESAEGDAAAKEDEAEDNGDGGAPAFLKLVNPESEVIVRSFVESALVGSKVGDVFQMERTGFFCVDVDSTFDAEGKATMLVLNRTLKLDPTTDARSDIFHLN